jgi:cation:H+ antiporter
LIVAGVATARGSSQIAMGSLVGSIIANVSLGLAIACLVASVRVDSRTVRRELPLSVGAVLLLVVVAHGGTSRSAGLAFAVALVIALVGLLTNARQAMPQDELGVEAVEFFDERHPHRVASELTRTALSAAVMIGGAVLLVRSCADLAKRLGVAQGLAGLTDVAVGTSAPPIVSSIQAARRGDLDLVVGNILGGNLFIALVGGATVAVLGRSEASSIGDAPLWLMATLVVAAWGFMVQREGALEMGSGRSAARVCSDAPHRHTLRILVKWRLPSSRGSRLWSSPRSSQFLSNTPRVVGARACRGRT